MNGEDYVKDEDYSLRVIITKMPWLRPTFPPAEAGSIIGADSFHFLVRDGKGWYRVAPVTRATHIINQKVLKNNKLFKNFILKQYILRNIKFYRLRHFFILTCAHSRF